MILNGWVKNIEGKGAETMNTIWKYKLKVEDSQVLSIPTGAVPLKVGVQKPIFIENPVIWFQVDPDAELIDVRIITKGTGHRFEPDNLWYIGSYQIKTGSDIFVGHVFLEGK